MEFTCSRHAFQDALSLVGSVVPARSAKPILQNIRIAGGDGNVIELAATDLEVGLEYRLDVEHLQDAEATALPASELINIVRDAWGETVTVRVENNLAEVITEGGRFQIPGEPADDFPEIPSVDEGASVEIRAEDLSLAIARVLFATARDENQYSLAGVSVALTEKTAEFAATDTFRLALAIAPLHAGGVEANAIVLAKGMHELQRLIADEEMVRLQITDAQCFAATSRATLVSRLIEGKFPQYQNVIPKDLGRKATVERVRFLEALRQAAHVANPETRAVSLVCHDAVMEIRTGSDRGGEAQIEIEAEVEGGEVSVQFNYAYLVDVLKVLEDEKVTLQLRDRESPGRIDAKQYTYVISPVCTRG